MDYGEWLAAQKYAGGAEEVMRKMLQVIAREASKGTPKDYRKVARDMRERLIMELHAVEREHLLRRRRCAEAMVGQTASKSGATGCLTGLPGVVPIRPAVTRRRRAAMNAEVQATSQTSVLSVAPSVATLDEDGKEALFSRLCPTQVHYEHFLDAMNDAERALSESEFQKMRDAIVTVLQLLEAGEDPRNVPNLAPSNSSNIYKSRPLGLRHTYRLFLGRIDGEFFIMMLASDVKSGANTENRLIQKLSTEASRIESAWKREAQSQ